MSSKSLTKETSGGLDIEKMAFYAQKYIDTCYTITYGFVVKNKKQTDDMIRRTHKSSKELADIYYKDGFTDVEAKAGQHHGTYKVFVNYIPVADITQLPKEIFNAIADHVQALKSKIDIPAQEVKCTSCETEFLMPVTMDQSNFFAVRS